MEQSLQGKEGVHEGQPGAMSKPEKGKKSICRGGEGFSRNGGLIINKGLIKKSK